MLFESCCLYIQIPKPSQESSPVLQKEMWTFWLKGTKKKEAYSNPLTAYR